MFIRTVPETFGPSSSGPASDLAGCLRVALFSMAICVAGYTALVLGIAQAVTPATADGSLIRRADGTVLGSRLIAQSFSAARYVWPRPSAVGYAAEAAGGSNLTPTSRRLTERAMSVIAAEGGASHEAPVPADLVTASASGLDPDVTLAGALFQADRVARARGVPVGKVVQIIRDQARPAGKPLDDQPLVNVLLLNLELDRALAAAPGRP